MPTIDRARLDAAYRIALDALLKERHPDGYWVGELSSSALSTATAVMALHLMRTQTSEVLIDRGLAWLIEHQNADGGWGDTVKSFSNISTTMLCRAAFYLAGDSGSEAVKKAEAWLGKRYGSTPAQLAEAVRARYGKDRTFATPILTTCALAGLVDWREVPPLPFELACLPQSWFRFLRLHVVSYALPALIAIGQCIHHHRPTWNPVTRLLRALSRKRSLRVLEKIQPSSGGFLEATPLTSFVTLSLAACGLADHPVAKNGMRFLVNSVRPDGSWAIDSNLSTWVTTLAINALAAAGDVRSLSDRDVLCNWLVQQQFRERHPYTGAASGGWAWTPLPGGVPDGDDTPGALIALTHLPEPVVEKVKEPYINQSVSWIKGELWLARLQNGDGGWPTFCRGWGHLSFDRSGCDLTAHVLRAIRASYHGQISALDLAVLPAVRQMGISLPNALGFLANNQRPDGAWLPLWFGNQHMPDDENPTYGTARVLAAYRDLGLMHDEPARRGVAWLVNNQNDDGGWGGGKGTPSSMEETALAVEALLDAACGLAPAAAGPNAKPQAADAVERGLAWLIEHVERGDLYNPSPIGFYFAKLWYFEKLYPMIFTVAALGRARVQYGNVGQDPPSVQPWSAAV
ncbi:MAG: squalene--hopene cyclase [Gemmataceae bacterium]|nr:squalene--hopene cyclase [Gemmataceae bacterium]